MLIVGAFLIIAPWPSPKPDYSTGDVQDYTICSKEMSEGTIRRNTLGYENIRNKGCKEGELVPNYLIIEPVQSVVQIDYTKVVSRLIGLSLILIVILVCLVRIILWIAHKLTIATGKEREKEIAKKR